MPPIESEEQRKMLAGVLYDPNETPLVEARFWARALARAYNQIDEANTSQRRSVLLDLLAEFGEGSEIVAPFHCDYGQYIRMGSGVFLNFNCVLLDCNWITIGDRTLIGPGVYIYAATHPLDPEVRAKGLELTAPVTVGSDVWIGGGAILCPGITIGNGSTIGAGSVVTRDVPAGVFAAGNPCRVIRTIACDSAPMRAATE